jgi:hypothetical protein
MNHYQLIVQKITYYQRWYKDLNIQEQRGWLGHWIKERIKWYDRAIDDIAKKN